jgi:hypothetical protein
MLHTNVHVRNNITQPNMSVNFYAALRYKSSVLCTPPSALSLPSLVIFKRDWDGFMSLLLLEYPAIEIYTDFLHVPQFLSSSQKLYRPVISTFVML